MKIGDKVEISGYTGWIAAFTKDGRVTVIEREDGMGWPRDRAVDPKYVERAGGNYWYVSGKATPIPDNGITISSSSIIGSGTTTITMPPATPSNMSKPKRVNPSTSHANVRSHPQCQRGIFLKPIDQSQDRSNPRCNKGDDPKTHDNTGFAPTNGFEMMVEGGATKKFFAMLAFFGNHLNNHRS